LYRAIRVVVIVATAAAAAAAAAAVDVAVAVEAHPKCRIVVSNYEQLSRLGECEQGRLE